MFLSVILEDDLLIIEALILMFSPGTAEACAVVASINKPLQASIIFLISSNLISRQ